MTVLELGNKLSEMYETVGTNKSTMIHLFGVIYMLMKCAMPESSLLML